MYKWLLAILLFTLGKFSFAQSIDFAYSSIKEAVENNEAGKLIFVDFYASWCGPCKAMEANVFTDSAVASHFNKEFVNVRVLTDNENGKKEAMQFGVREFPTYVFLNRNGELVHKTVGFHQKELFLREARIAKHESTDFVSLKSLEERFKNGEREKGFLADYLSRKNEEEGPQPDLINIYLNQVPENEWQTEKVLELISVNITSVFSTGFEILTQSLRRFHMLTESQQKSVLSGISRAKRSTFQKAVENRDSELFNALIDAVFLTSYSHETAIAEERQFRYDYAKLTKNFAHFSVIAREEAENILRMSDDDFEKRNEEILEQFKSNAQFKGVSEEAPQYQIIKESLRNSAKKSASFQLNEFAWGYYQMTEDKPQLNHAIRWSAYAIRLYETPANWETYAFLLKKVGRKRDAKRAMKQAVKLAQKQGVDTQTLKQAYQKIKG